MSTAFKSPVGAYYGSMTGPVKYVATLTEFKLVSKQYRVYLFTLDNRDSFETQVHRFDQEQVRGLLNVESTFTIHDGRIVYAEVTGL